MAKEHAPQRSLTPEEQARRKATMGGANPLKGKADGEQPSGPVPIEAHKARLERAAQIPGPMVIDYDRDGYPDAIVGRSGRNFRQRAHAANKENPVSMEAALDAAKAIAGRRRDGRGAYAPGDVGYQQNQMGYRERARVRLEAVAKAEPGEDKPILPKVKYTSAEQAAIAPRTQLTGFENKGAQRAAVGDRERAGVAIPIPGPGDETIGPIPAVRRASFGSIPAQGTMQDDGSFAVSTTPPETPEEGKSGPKTAGHAMKPHEHAAKVTEHKSHEHDKQADHVKSAEHTVKVAEQTLKSAEHTAKSAEHAKPHEHGKPPEPHKK